MSPALNLHLSDSSQPPSEVGALVPTAQRGEMTCPRSASFAMVQRGPEPMSIASRAGIRPSQCHFKCSAKVYKTQSTNGQASGMFCSAEQGFTKIPWCRDLWEPFLVEGPVTPSPFDWPLPQPPTPVSGAHAPRVPAGRVSPPRTSCCFAMTAIGVTTCTA